jgi:hypothetical protein
MLMVKQFKERIGSSFAWAEEEPRGTTREASRAARVHDGETWLLFM